MTDLAVRLAVEADIAALKQLTDACKRELGFISRGMLRSAIARAELLLAERGDSVGGFVDFHHRRDGQITIYCIIVGPQQRCQGVGRTLVAALIARQPTTIALKCPTDNPANDFYAALGFRCVGIAPPTKHRPLNLWQLQVRSSVEP